MVIHAVASHGPDPDTAFWNLEKFVLLAFFSCGFSHFCIPDFFEFIFRLDLANGNLQHLNRLPGFRTAPKRYFRIAPER
jgi:hypothetical protein